MSRKWERMINKNTKQSNKLRSMQGKQKINDPGKEVMMQFKGRSWILPMFLVGFAIFYTLSFRKTYGGDTVFWLTVASYFLFGLYVFFIRRPFINIGKDRISTRKFTGIKYVNADQIEEISIDIGSIVIQTKDKKDRWVFTQLIQLFKIKEIEDPLREFASKHRIPIADK